MMIKTLFTTTAAALLFAGVALAQTAPPTAPSNPLRPAPSAPRVTPPATAPAPQAAPAATTAAPAKAPAAKGSGAARRTQCSKEYQAAKAANTLNGQKWGQFYSACNTRLKAQGQ